MSLVVEKIVNGTVIDHIAAGKGLAVLKILGITAESDYRVALLLNVFSRKYGKKDIVKIAGKHLDEKEVNKIALVAPNATMNIVSDSVVKDKRVLQIPNSLVGVVKCPNPNCITNAEQMETKFVKDAHFEGFRCAYCERFFESKELSNSV